MPFRLRKNDKKIIKMLLDIYADATGLPVAYYDTHSNQYIWSSKGNYGPLCVELNGKFIKPETSDKECAQDHTNRCNNPSGKMEICHVGFWNVALPIKFGEMVVGTLLSGQRKINSPQMMRNSEEAFRHFNERQTDENQKAKFEALFNDTPSVVEEDFHTHLLENLRKIQEHLYNWLYEQRHEIRDFRERVHTLAHEFLIPIQSIIADSENLFLETEDAELKGMAANILNEMQKLAFIAENMRSAIIGAKREQYIFEAHNIYRILKKSCDLYQSEARQKGVEIRNPIAVSGSDFPRIEIELTQVQIAINNVIQNAVKYSYHSATGGLYIDIKCKKNGNFYTIEISNLGTGILPEEIEQGLIFQAGYRGVLSIDKFRTGSGLGLSEVLRIVEQHGGNIKVESIKTKSEAYKTTVSISLPIHQKH